MSFFTEFAMHPKLNVQREQQNEIICGYREPMASTPFHFHSHMELYLVEEGTVDVWVNQRQKRLRSGEMAVIMSYDAHRYEPIIEGKTAYLIIPVNLCGEFNGKHIDDPFINDPVLLNDILKCCEVISQRRNRLLTAGCIQVVFGLLLEKLQFTQRRSPTEASSMTHSLLYLHDHFKDNLSLSAAASALGFTPSYLSHLFKESLGIGFHQYLTMLRLREAALLLSRGYAVNYSAYESGFHSTRTFYRAFYHEFGCTPKEYVKHR